MLTVINETIAMKSDCMHVKVKVCECLCLGPFYLNKLLYENYIVFLFDIDEVINCIK